MSIACMLWAFKMDPLPEEPIDLEEYDGDSGRSPVPYRIRLKPIHDRVADILSL